MRKGRLIAERLADSLNQTHHGEGFADEEVSREYPVRGSELGGIGGHEEHLCLGPGRTQPVGELRSVHPRHHDIAQQQMNGSVVLLGDPQRIFSTRRLKDREPLHLKNVPNEGQHIRVVISHEDTNTVGLGSGHMVAPGSGGLLWRRDGKRCAILTEQQNQALTALFNQSIPKMSCHPEKSATGISQGRDCRGGVEEESHALNSVPSARCHV